jgi:4-aminobutyrate aminotransferase
MSIVVEHPSPALRGCMRRRRRRQVDLAARYQQAFAPVMPMETELEIDHGEGSYLVAQDGRRYLDLATGIAVNALGYGHPAVMAAIREQAERNLHLYHGTGYQEVVVAYAEALLAEVGGDRRLFFGNSGAEAVEAAIKLARYSTGRPALIAFRGAFHGRTLGALSLTASAARYRAPYEPLVPSVYHVDYPAPTRLGLDPAASLEHVKAQMQALLDDEVSPDRVAAVFVEAVQGEGGYVVPPAGFLPWLQDLTRAHGILLVADEVQAGMGRTGRMFAYQHSGIEPDIIVMGKALGGGLPLSAMVGPAPLMQAWHAGAHGSTFGGSPLACATGLATLGVIRSEGLVGRAAELGRLAVDRLTPLEERAGIAQIRGLGLMVAVEFGGGEASERVAQTILGAVKRGMILHAAGLRHEVVRLMPPLNIDREVFARALDDLREIVDECLHASPSAQRP